MNDEDELKPDFVAYMGPNPKSSTYRQTLIEAAKIAEALRAEQELVDFDSLVQKDQGYIDEALF